MNRMLMPVSACSRRISVEDLRLDGDVQRGGRLVGDQQRRIAGHRQRDHHALAHAAESWCGYSCRRWRRGRDLDQVEHAQGVRQRRRRGPGPCAARTLSAICSPMVKTGFRLVIGSWKIIASSLPRSLRMRARRSLSRSTTAPSRSRTALSPLTCALAVWRQAASASGWSPTCPSPTRRPARSSCRA